MTEIEELVLNNPAPEYKVFYGQNPRQMYNLFKDPSRREPATVSQIVEMKNKSFYSLEETFKNSWWGSYFDTADVIVYEPRGEGILIAKKPLILKSFNPWLVSKEEMIDGALKLSPLDYEILSKDALKLSKKEIKQYINLYPESDLTTPQEILDNPVWNYLFKGDESLLKEHVNYLFGSEKQKNAMRIFIKPSLLEVPTLRLWTLKGNTSDLYGTYPLDADNGRLVGILEEINRRNFLLGMNKTLSDIEEGVNNLGKSLQSHLEKDSKSLSNIIK